MPSQYLPGRNCDSGSGAPEKFKGEPEHVVNYLFMVAEELRSIMAELGLRTVNEMIGRVDLLDADAAIDHWKASGLDLSRILEPAKVIFENTEFYRTQAQDHGLRRHWITS